MRLGYLAPARLPNLIEALRAGLGLLWLVATDAILSHTCVYRKRRPF
jgi:hypothetical protein